MEAKYYNDKQIYAATFFGGPIPPGYLIYKNFKTLGEEKKAQISLYFTFAFTIIFFYLLLTLPDSIISNTPSFFISLIYTGIVIFVYKKFLEKSLSEKLEDGNNKESNWNVAGITVAGLLLNILLIYSISSSQPAFAGEKFEFGSSNHEIFYDENSIDKLELNEVGEVLTYFGLFNNQNKYSVKVKVENDTKILVLPMGKHFWENTQLLEELKVLKDMLKEETGEEYNLELFDYDLAGKKLTKSL